MDENNDEKNIKIVLLGGAVGKTAIINKYINENYSLYKIPISSQYQEKTIWVRGKNVNLEIWDTSGQEAYRSLNKLFVKNSKIVVLVYDITRKTTFEDLQYWYDFLKNELGEDIILGLAGNKSDLFECEEVSLEEGRECAENWGAVFSLLSAKEDKRGIEEFFTKLVIKYLEKKDSVIRGMEIIKLEKNEYKERNNSSCYGGKNNKKEKGIKIAFLGMNGVGKTNIISTICGKKINTKYEHTKKIINKKINIFLENKNKIKINIIDTNGDDCNDSDIKIILDDCKILFLVFDFKNRKSFEKLDTLIKTINKYKKEKKYINIIGNKSNFSKGKKDYVTEKEGENFALMNSCNYECFSIEKVDKIQDLIKRTINIYLND